MEVISGCGELVALSLRTLLILDHADIMIRYNRMVRYKFFISEPVCDQNMGFFSLSLPVAIYSCPVIMKYWLNVQCLNRAATPMGKARG